MKKIIKAGVLLIIFMFGHGPASLSASESLLDGADIAVADQLDFLDYGEVKSVIGNEQTLYEVDFEDLVSKAVAGELDLSLTGILKGGLQLLFSEIYEHVGLLKNLLVIGLLSALLKNLTESFENKSVGEIGFYISYIALVIVLFSSFRIGVGIMESLVSSISNLISAAIPLITSLVLMSGNITGAYVFNAVLVLVINIITVMVRDLFGPMIIVVSTMHVVNYLTENETLSNLCELLKNIISWALKAVAICFVSILTIQKISSPIVNNLAMKTAKSTINVVPVVGEILTGAMDTVSYWISAAKSGVLIAVLLTIIAVCAIPLIKLVALIGIYKITAAVIQPICDKRVVKCIDTIGDYTVLMFSAGFIVVAMFVIAAMVVLSF